MFDQVMERIAGRFARVEPRRRARALVLGLLSDLPRKNCWTVTGRTAEELLRRLVRAVLEHQGGSGLRDDATLLLVQWTGT